MFLHQHFWQYVDMPMHVEDILTTKKVKVKVKQSHYRPGQVLSFQEVEAPRFQDNRHMKMVRLSALRTGCLYPQEIFLVLISESTPGPECGQKDNSFISIQPLGRF
jgi:hypothetical protein